jgi:hypothetical protein
LENFVTEETAEAVKTEIDTSEYEAAHGKKPVWNAAPSASSGQEGAWLFRVPRQYGKRDWRIVGLNYKEACDLVRERARVGGVFTLLP